MIWKKNLNNASFGSSTENVLAELMYMSISNNSMLMVILDNKSKINAILDPSKNKDEHQLELLEKVKNANNELFPDIINRIGDK